MAGKTNTSATFFAQKKLLGKAHTSNLKIDGEEVIGSNIQAASSLIFGETIPTSPSLTLNSVQGSVEYIQFVLEALTGTTYDANDPDGGSGEDAGDVVQASGPHAYKFKFPNNYESITNNPKSGQNGFFNNSIIHETLGKVQIIPPFFSQDAPNPYIVKLYKNNGGVPGDEIPLLDNIDWNVDYYNGILFIQDYDVLKIPAFARAFAYTGKMLNTVISEIEPGTGGGGGTGDGDSQAEYLVLSLTGSLPNAKTLQAGQNIAITEGSTSITISATGLTAINGRDKDVYFVTGTHTAGNSLDLPSVDFASVDYDSNKIDVLYNGMLIHSGTYQQVIDAERDYYIDSAGSIVFSFDLFSDDIIDTSISIVGGASSGGADLNAEFIVATLTGSLPNAKLLTAGENISISTVSDTIVISSTGVALVNGRNKASYYVTSSHTAGNPFSTPLSRFEEVSYSPSKIDVLYNGVLLHSGTNSDVVSGERDYTLSSNDSVVFGFDLFSDDIVDVIVNIVGGVPDTQKTDPYAEYLVISLTGSLYNQRAIDIGTGLKYTDGGSGGNFTIEVEKEMVFNEILSGIVDGENTLFYLSNTPFSNSEVSIFVNGLLQMPPDKISFQDYSITGSMVYFTTASVPHEGSWIMANYYKAV